MHLKVVLVVGVQDTRTYSHAYSYVNLKLDTFASAYAYLPAFLSRCHSL